MKTLITMFSITLIAFTARASEPVPYIAMPINNGYAIDAHGKRQPNALCARDVIWACAPPYPSRAQPSEPSYNNQIGRLAILDGNSTWAFSRWVFTPGKWSAMIIPTAVRINWVPVLVQEREP
jgi:hypothetical protein